MKGAVEAIALRGVSAASKAAGKKVAQIPLVNKVPFGEALVAGGKQLKKLESTHVERTMGDFGKNQDLDIQLFLNNIEAINKISNQATEILFDKNNIYICTQE